MKQTSKNFLYNVLYQLFTFIIPLITVPYVSRTLGANNIGIYSYTYSLVYYFMLVSMLGINNYGAREIAKLSNDKSKMSKKFFSIYLLQLITNILMIILYIIFMMFYNYEFKIILVIQTVFLVSCAFDINWFFFGLEEFKITISRNIIIKLFSLLLIFLFVKSKNDLWIYTLIMSSSTLISQMYLWIFLKKRINFQEVSFSEIFFNLKPCLILFIPIIAYSIYRVTDKTMIGAISSTLELGFYENAEKIINIPLSFVTALGTVMLPHMSKINESEFEKKINYSFKLCFFILIPFIICLSIVSKNFSIIFFGDEFAKSAYIMILLAPTVLFGGITNVIRTNYLIPKSKDKIYVTSTIIGAVINLILNFIFIPKFGAIGACIGTIITEFSIMIYQIIKTRKVINYKEVVKNSLSFVLKTFIISIIVFLIAFLIKSPLLKLILQIIIAVIVYLILNYKYIMYEFLGLKQKTQFQK